ncbi:MAG: HAD-IA family hydrolase [Cellvibrionaceae bacterium]
MNLKAVLFDLDGTLLDTAPDFVTTVNRLMAEENLPDVPAERTRKTVSNGARALVNMAFGIGFEEPGFDRLHKRLLEIYTEQLAVDTIPFPGIQDVLSFLGDNKIPWGIVTNKSITYTQPILNALAFNPAPQSVICPDHVEKNKPDPESLFLACKQLNCQTEEIIYIGDHKRDIICGQRAGSKTIAAVYGYVPEGDNPVDWNADYIVDSAHGILPIIKKYLD